MSGDAGDCLKRLSRTYVVALRSASLRFAAAFLALDAAFLRGPARLRLAAALGRYKRAADEIREPLAGFLAIL
jgi:hypothetical protein